MPKSLRPKETLTLSLLSSSLCYWGSGTYRSLHFFLSDVLRIDPEVMWPVTPHCARWTRSHCCFLRTRPLWNCYSVSSYSETKVWVLAIINHLVHLAIVLWVWFWIFHLTLSLPFYPSKTDRPSTKDLSIMLSYLILSKINHVQI